jgi:hypothetical protein
MRCCTVQVLFGAIGGNLSLNISHAARGNEACFLQMCINHWQIKILVNTLKQNMKILV